MPKTTTHTDLDPRIDTYHFYEQEWEGYEQLIDAFEHDVPDQFDLATYLCDRWADADPERVAVHALGADGTETRYTYGDLHRDANRLAGHLADAGIDTGDRIAVTSSEMSLPTIHQQGVLTTIKVGGRFAPHVVRLLLRGKGKRLAPES